MLKLIEKVERKKSIVWQLLKLLVILIIVVAVFNLIVYIRVVNKYSGRIKTLENISQNYRAALVFGAGLKTRDVPSDMLEDRLMAAIKVYQAGKVDYLVLSGDSSMPNHNEVQAMKNLAVEEGLPEEALLLDYWGLSTYDSCYRAKKILHLDKVILITQKYHLNRALYVCNEIGLDAIGFSSEDKYYSKLWFYSLREIPATLADFWKLIFNR